MIIFIILISVFAVLLISGIYCTRNLKSNIYKLSFKNLPGEFKGFRIAQISDMHNCTYGENNEKLLSIIKDSRPDIIVITGDMIDSRRTNINIAENFARQIVRIAPCYYVCGNHEARMPKEYKTLLEKLNNAGVSTMQNSVIKIKRGGNHINLAGAEDPYVIRRESDAPNSEIMDKVLSDMLKNRDADFTVLLSHRPELFSVYADHRIDLCLTGHAHGGQIRLPFIGGLFAPNQGFLPKLDAGVFKKKNTTMFISRGVGNSQFPIRFLNPPEIPIIELTKE